MTPEENGSGTTDQTITTGSAEHLVETPASVDSADYQAFLDDYSNQFTPEGEVLHGHVLSVSDKEVIVDIGRKTEGSGTGLPIRVG